MALPLKLKFCLGASLATSAILTSWLVADPSAQASREGKGATSFSLSTLKGKRLAQLLPGQFCLIRDEEHKFLRTVVDHPEVVGLSVIGKNLVALEAVAPGVAIVSFADDGDNWLALEVQVEKPVGKKTAVAVPLDLNLSKNRVVSSKAGRIVKIREVDFKAAASNPTVAVVVPRKGMWDVAPSEKPEYFQIFPLQSGNVKLGNFKGSDCELKVEPSSVSSTSDKYAPLMAAVPAEKEAAVYLKLAQYWRDQYFQVRKGAASKSNVQAEVFKKFAIDSFERAEKLDGKGNALKERRAFLEESGK